MSQVQKLCSLPEYGQIISEKGKPVILFFYDSGHEEQRLFLASDLAVVAFEVGDGASVATVDVREAPGLLAALLDPALHDRLTLPIIRLSYGGLATDHLRIASRNRLIEAITDRQDHPLQHPDHNPHPEPHRQLGTRKNHVGIRLL